MDLLQYSWPARAKQKCKRFRFCFYAVPTTSHAGMFTARKARSKFWSGGFVLRALWLGLVVNWR